MQKKVIIKNNVLNSEEFKLLINKSNVIRKERGNDSTIYELQNPKFRVVVGDIAEILSRKGEVYVQGKGVAIIGKVDTNYQKPFSLQTGEERPDENQDLKQNLQPNNKKVNVNKNQINVNGNPETDKIKGDNKTEKDNKELPKKYSKLYQLAVSKGFDIEIAGDRKAETLRKYLYSINLQE